MGPEQIENKSEVKYLGDILSNDGRNLKNIKDRQKRCQGVVNQIMSILQEIYLGKYHFETAIVLRNSLLISSMLSNSEEWYNMTNVELNMLDKIEGSSKNPKSNTLFGTWLCIRSRRFFSSPLHTK